MIFILGCHKSGTSLIRSLLDGHPDLNVIPFETHFFEHLGLSGIYPMRKGQNKSLNFNDSFVRNLKEYNEFGSPFSDVIMKGKINLDVLQKYMFDPEKEGITETFIQMTRAIFESLNQNNDNTKIIVEKSVENIQYAGFLKSLFPQSVFIHILRNPYSNMVSLRKFKTIKNFPSLPEIFESINLSFTLQEANSKLINAYYSLKYEDLLLNPVDTMKNLAYKIGIEYTESLIQPTTMGEPWKGNSIWNLQLDKISSESLNNWKKEITAIEARYINHKMKENLEKWNYDKFESVGSVWKMAKGENFKTYIRNRIFLYY